MESTASCLRFGPSEFSFHVFINMTFQSSDSVNVKIA